MKTKTAKKVIVAAMATAMGAGIVGSISGTVAWYQYSTRSTVAYQGASAKCSENLQVKFAGWNDDANTWKQDLTTDNIKAYLIANSSRTASNYNEVRPVTSGNLASGEAAFKFYKSPIYQYPEINKWGEASKTVDFIEIPLEFRVADVDGNRNSGDFANFLAKKVYLSDLTIQANNESASTKGDLSEAIRVSFTTGTVPSTGRVMAGRTYALKAGETAVAGALDLNNDNKKDTTAAYEFQTAGTELAYGEQDGTKKAITTAVQKETSGSYENDYAADNNSLKVVNDSNPLTLVGKELGTTVATGNNLVVTVRIYLEGWSLLGDHTVGTGSDSEDMKAVWDDVSFVAAKFAVGMRFTAEAVDPVTGA